MTIPAEAALSLYMQRNILGRYDLIDKAKELESYGIFSQAHMIQLTELPDYLVRERIEKSNHVGGRFNAEMLPLIYDFWLSLNERPRGSVPDVSLLKIALENGNSLRFLSKLIDTPYSTMLHWLKSEA